MNTTVEFCFAVHFVKGLHCEKESLRITTMSKWRQKMDYIEVTHYMMGNIKSHNK